MWLSQVRLGCRALVKVILRQLVSVTMRIFILAVLVRPSNCDYRDVVLFVSGAASALIVMLI